MIEQIQQLDSVIWAITAVVITLIASYVYGTKKKDEELSDRVSEDTAKVKVKLSEVIEELKQKSLKYTIYGIGLAAFAIAFEVDTPFPDNIELTVMYLGVSLVPAHFLVPWAYKKIRTRQYNFLHEKNPVKGKIRNLELDTKDIEKITVVDAIEDEDGEPQFIEKSWNDLKDITVVAKFGEVPAKECYRFYDDNMIAVTTRAAGMSIEELEEYEDSFKYLDAINSQMAADHRRLTNKFEILVDKNSDEKLNEVLHDLQEVAYNEERSFSERIKNDIGQPIQDILDETTIERVDKEHPREKHNKNQMLDAFEDAENPEELISSGEEQ